MTKWKCVDNNGCPSKCEFETTSTGKPYLCPVDGNSARWEENENVDGETFYFCDEVDDAEEKIKRMMPENELPKLTVEVFDRPDCPEWANYAAVDSNGAGYYYSEKPFILSDAFGWGIVCSENNRSEFISGVFNNSDWQNSLIERPAKLPDWVEIGGYVYSPRNGYGKIISGSVKSCYIEFDGGAGDFQAENFALLFLQARLRPYSPEEMSSLVGKVLHHSTGAYLVTAFENRWNQVKIESVWRDADELMKLWTWLDGKPCGVLEHLEDGEWVE